MVEDFDSREVIIVPNIFVQDFDDEFRNHSRDLMPEMTKLNLLNHFI